MTGRKAVGVLALAVYGWTTGIRAQQEPNDLAKPTVPIVSVVGCASRDGRWHVDINERNEWHRIEGAVC